MTETNSTDYLEVLGITENPDSIWCSVPFGAVIGEKNQYLHFEDLVNFYLVQLKTIVYTGGLIEPSSLKDLKLLQENVKVKIKINDEILYVPVYDLDIKPMYMRSNDSELLTVRFVLYKNLIKTKEGS